VTTSPQDFLTPGIRAPEQSRSSEMLERRDRVAPIRDLDLRDHDVFRAKALRARMAARREKGT